MRVCTGCGETKSLAEFGKYSKRSKPSLAGKPHSRCIACKSRARRFKNRGITPKQFEAMVLEQKGRCYLCQLETELHIDHNHVTDKVRHLLCNTCNWRIGMLENLPLGWLAKALRYIDDL